MASSRKQIHESSSSHDVFLSFRDSGTSKSFVHHLYTALKRDGIQTFSYHSLREVERSSQFGEAIAKSKVLIVILSTNYADSEWCLDELVEINRYRRKKGRKMIPIFYDVDPLQVRYQSDKFGTAFAQLKDHKNVKIWKNALTDVSYDSRWALHNLQPGSEAKFISEIVASVVLEIDKIVVFPRTITNVKSKVAGIVEDKFRFGFGTLNQDIPSIMLPTSPTNIDLTPSLINVSHPYLRLQNLEIMSLSGQSLHLDLIESETLTPPKHIGALGSLRRMELFRWSSTRPYNKSDRHLKSNHWLKKINSTRNYGDPDILRNPRFDVFLSFTTEDNDLGRELNRALVRAGIKTFISPFGYINEEVVNKSRIVMIVLSKEYTCSKYRLDDLARLMDHKMMRGQCVIPVFYNISPAKFGYQKGKDAEAPTLFQGKIINYHALMEDSTDGGQLHSGTEEGRWRTAMMKAALLPGYYLKMVAYKEDEWNAIASNISVLGMERERNTTSVVKNVENFSNLPVLRNENSSNISLVRNKEDKYFDPYSISLQLRSTSSSVPMKEKKSSISLPFNLSPIRSNVRTLDSSVPWNKEISSSIPELGNEKSGNILDPGNKMYFGSYSTRHKVRSNESYFPRNNEKKSVIYFNRIVKKIVTEVHRKVLDMARNLVVRVPHQLGGTEQLLIYGNLRTCLINDMSFTAMKQARPSSVIMSLKILNVSYTQSLVESPPFSAIQNLEILILRGCINLVEISQSIEMAKRLHLLDTRDCKSLAKLPKNICTLRFLETLNLSGCSSLLEIPTGINNLESLKEFQSDGVAILTLLTSHQADMMGLGIDFPKRSGTMSDTRKLFGQIEKAQLEYEILSPKFRTRFQLKVINLANSKLSEFPNYLICPSLEKLFLQSNPDLRDIPSSFFEQMPVLKVLDMSETSIKSLPPSASKLVRLEELVLRGCELLIELPHEIGELQSLKILDLEGTDLVCLPQEIGKLIKLEFLRVSLYDAKSYRINKEIEAIIPRSILSKLIQLKELNIYVDPHDIWWNDAIRAIFNSLPSLRKLKSLRLYVPTSELLQEFLKLDWHEDTPSVYQSLSHFYFIVGTQGTRVISRVPHVLEEEFLKFDRGIKHINGKDNIIQLAEALRHTNALYLDRHWTIKTLSVFTSDELNELKFCLLVDCNEMQSVFNGCDFSRGVDKGDNLLSLQYLGIFYLKNLEFIWKGPIDGSCLSCLKILAVYMCPNLTVIFTPILLQYLVNLTEIIIEDCPKIKTLVTIDSFETTSQQFLPRLKKLSLLNLPELVSLSSGLKVGPKLEKMVIYDCPKLKSLSSAEVCNNQIKEIKGENEWWKSLEWHELGFSGGQPDYLSCAYSKLDIDKDLLDESAPLYGISVPL